MQRITRRRFAAGLAGGAAARDARPNIVIVYCDELRATALRLYHRDGLRTANIERLAGRGVVYDRAITTHPLCVPARCSLWTGQYSSTHGSRTNQRLLPGDRPNMAQILHNAGYALGIFGKNHCFTPEQLRQWFRADYSSGSEAWRKALTPAEAAGVRKYQEWVREQGGGTMPPKAAPFPPEIGGTHLIAQRAIEFIEASPGPFAAWVSFPDPHHPVQVPEKYASAMPAGAVRLPRTVPGEIKTKNTRMQIFNYLVRGSELPDDFLRQFLSIYYGMIACIDDEVGRILDLLDRRGIAQNTILLFTADHGDFAAEHRLVIKTGSLLDSMVRVPMILSIPGRGAGGRRETAPVSQIDILPTLLSACGLPVPRSVEGRQLPLRGSDPKRAFAYSEYGAGGAMYTWDDARAIGPAQRLGDYALNTSILAEHLRKREAAGHLRMVTSMSHKLIVDSNGERELYDLTKDPEELTNVQGERAYGGVERELQHALDSRAAY